ncbi:MAG: hypothetical protein CL912_08780 [Deltaproteobacteria bacterium]|nr:hypothetical protein [Deltaproteobacteria bacterium]|tara:strand:+ start:907 stop:1188 length:282 start_codon:yes stop_codon:yes gene_type:complete
MAELSNEISNEGFDDNVSWSTGIHEARALHLSQRDTKVDRDIPGQANPLLGEVKKHERGHIVVASEEGCTSNWTIGWWSVFLLVGPFLAGESS